MQKFIINSGVYGDDKNNILLNYSNSNGNKIKQLFRRFWLKYDVIKEIYPILKKHKWLTPFCQARRWLKLFTPKYFRKAFGEAKVLKGLNEADSKELQSMLQELK